MVRQEFTLIANSHAKAAFYFTRLCLRSFFAVVEKKKRGEKNNTIAQNGGGSWSKIVATSRCGMRRNREAIVMCQFSNDRLPAKHRR
jgi:hypothetical protein